MYCSKCGGQIGNARFCSQCGTPQGGIVVQAPGAAPQVVVIRAPKSPGVAVLLSFLLAGLGQIYNGQIGKGLVFMIAYFCSLVLMWVLIGFIIAPILWIWSMVDAYKTAERINAQYGV
jgi:TM2 domain-containing membrane protein YozV